MELLVQAVLNGIALAAIYALISLGLTLVFGVMDVVNFAYGQMLLVAGYLTYELTNRGVNFWLVGGALLVAFAVIGAAIEKAFFAPVRDAPINGLLVSIGLISVLENLIEAIWGPDQYMVDRPVEGAVNIGSFFLARVQVVNVGIAVAAMIALALVLRRSKIGRAMRATAENRDAAMLMGIRVQRINTVAFAVSAVFAALSGILIAAMLPINPSLGDSFLVFGFTALIIGGAGSPQGAVLGALVTGLAIAISQTFGSTLVASLAPLLAMIAVLYVRPQGLIATRVESSL